MFKSAGLPARIAGTSGLGFHIASSTILTFIRVITSETEFDLIPVPIWERGYISVSGGSLILFNTDAENSTAVGIPFTRRVNHAVKISSCAPRKQTPPVPSSSHEFDDRASHDSRDERGTDTNYVAYSRVSRPSASSPSHSSLARATSEEPANCEHPRSPGLFRKMCCKSLLDTLWFCSDQFPSVLRTNFELSSKRHACPSSLGAQLLETAFGAVELRLLELLLARSTLAQLFQYTFVSVSCKFRDRDYSGTLEELNALCTRSVVTRQIRPAWPPKRTHCRATNRIDGFPPADIWDGLDHEKTPVSWGLPRSSDGMVSISRAPFKKFLNVPCRGGAKTAHCFVFHVPMFPIKNVIILRLLFWRSQLYHSERDIGSDRKVPWELAKNALHRPRDNTAQPGEQHTIASTGEALNRIRSLPVVLKRSILT
ncbi:hypothetical protein C8R45DRAFT_939690 [Mycena sanguinolenta]|nr:hypothetical protein C8R45DRAFT_939690 [Mycena sanguinolenta]